MTPLQESFHFHLANGGYATPPGRAQCALDRARAELAANTRDDIRFRWEDDSEYIDLSWDEDGWTKRRLESGEFECVGCVIEIRCPHCGSWDRAASLWSIIGPPDSPYRRVVEAELLEEALAA